jgi:hypothetical protein
MSLYINGDIRCGVNGFRVLILMQDGSVTDTDGDIIGKAVQVPPHGDLIDRAEIRKDWFRTELGTVAVALVDIDGAEAIIPADKEEPT